MQKLFFILTTLLIFCQNTWAELDDSFLLAGNKYVKTSLITDVESFQPKAESTEAVARIGVLLTIEPGWHIYWQNSGDSALPTKVNWKLPEGWRAGPLQWPAPTEHIERGDIVTFAYSKQVLLSADLYGPVVIPNIKESVNIEANISFLVCSDVCVPGRKTKTVSVPFSTEKPLSPSKHFAIFDAFRKTVARESLNDVKAFRSSKLHTETSHSGAEAGSSINASIAVQGIPKNTAQNAAKHINFFPLANEALKVGRGSALLTEINDEPSYLLTFPIEISKEATAGLTELKGIVVFSKTLSAESTDTSVSWSLPLNVVATGRSTPNPEFEQLSAKLKDAEKISFRVKSYQDSIEKNTSSSGTSTTLWFALLSAFLAGLVLNLMPCVLPIISIKVMGFLEHADKPRRRVLANSSAFALGILATFFVLALIVTSLRSLGTQLGWGFQFQYPEFVIGLAVGVFLLSLGFFEIYNFAIPYVQSANRSLDKLEDSLVKQFFDGIVATLLATPCTAPFLGTALAFAFTQPSYVTIAIFLAIGAGLALPYVYLSTHPKLLSRLPKPGEWMNRLKEFLGFLLLATVVWLLFVLNQLTSYGASFTLILLLFVYFCFWLRNSLKKSGTSLGRRKLVDICCLALVIFLGFYFWPELTTRRSETSIVSNSAIAWERYSADTLDAASASGQTVFIDFTADWCITCKANEHLVIETDAVASAFSANNVRALKADYTSGGEKITAALNRFGGQGVPYYVVIRPGEDAKILPTILTTSTIVDAIGKAPS